jgi:hypothetical protein
MTASDHELDDHALDAMLEAIARSDAPRTLTARVSDAIAGRESSALAGHRVGFALTVAVALVVLAVIWTASRHRMSPAPPLVAHHAPAATPRTGASPSSAAPLEPEATVATAQPVRVVRATQHRATPHDDHDRALPALATLPGVGPRDISPAALQTLPLQIDRIEDIAPLTIQGGRDSSGQGDF